MKFGLGLHTLHQLLPDDSLALKGDKADPGLAPTYRLVKTQLNISTLTVATFLFSNSVFNFLFFEMAAVALGQFAPGLFAPSQFAPGKLAPSQFAPTKNSTLTFKKKMFSHLSERFSYKQQ